MAVTPGEFTENRSQFLRQQNIQHAEGGTRTSSEDTGSGNWTRTLGYYGKKERGCLKTTTPTG